ncbi:MAG: hypothetical protein LBC73_10180 [Oscillospiraceae bacterium]|jgi:pyruvate/2-oxoglutarate dehydrogenase complex dihydrolipoamide acyltransferase (E2) component|nr:hypothetical protein [Oscillospiraceae bacterium]
MKDLQVKKRNWVKYVAFIFLTVIALLTFLSNTIMNHSLPEVAGQHTTSGTITARIRGSGTVSAVENFEVEVTSRRTVSAVLVRLGDEVSVGDVLIRFSGSGSAELDLARSELRALERKLEEMLLNAALNDNNFTMQNRAIQRMRASLAEAQAQLAGRPFNETAFNQAVADVKAAEAVVAAREYDRAMAELALEALQVGSASDSPEIISARTALINAEIALSRASDTLAVREVELAAAQVALAADPGNSALETAVRNAEAALATANSTVATRKNEVQAAQNTLNTLLLASGNSAALVQAEINLQNAEIALSRATVVLNEAEGRLALQAASRAAWVAVRDLQQELEDALYDLAEEQRKAGILSSISAIDFRELRREIEEKEEEVKELENEGGGTEITSMVNGIVKQINVTAGSQTDGSDTPLMIIENVDRGYTLSFPVSAEQATRVRVGDVAEVDRGWWGWGEPIVAILSSIRNNPQEPVTSRILEFNLSGDIESGSNLNITISQRSENYNIVVPNGAVRSDTNGTFVLVVESRSSPLGNRYVATRADVNVLATDDTHTAVSGALSGWDFVILTSNRPIEPGMQVRLVDNP